MLGQLNIVRAVIHQWRRSRTKPSVKPKALQPGTPSPTPSLYYRPENMNVAHKLLVSTESKHHPTIPDTSNSSQDAKVPPQAIYFKGKCLQHGKHLSIYSEKKFVLQILRWYYISMECKTNFPFLPPSSLRIQLLPY